MIKLKLRRIILLGLILSTGILNAQTDFRPGYIVYASGDTLFGQIDYRGDLLMSSLCKFKYADNTIREFSPTDILAYKFIDSKYYVSKEINGTILFLEYLIKGKVNFYYKRDYKGHHYFLDKEDVKLTEIPYEEGIKFVDNKQFFYETTRHIGLLNYYLQDAPEFQKRIQTIKKPGHKSLINLAEDYHNAVCEGEKCVIYEKRLPLLMFNFEIIGGIVRYQDTEDFYYFHNYSRKEYTDYNSDQKNFQIGIITHLWLPRTSEKLYFKTGILFSTLDAKNFKENIYKIPIQIEYIYPTGIIRPIAAYGINIYNPGFTTIAASCGVNIKLDKPVYLGLSYDIDFNPRLNFQLIPKSVFSQSILTRIIFEF